MIDYELIIAMVIIVINFVVLLINGIKLIVNRFKRKKNIAVATTEEEDVESVKTSAAQVVSLVESVIPQAMAQVEKSGITGSDNKKLLALSKVLLECEKEGIDYKKNASLIDDTIERLIDFSKVVNADTTKEGTQQQ